MIVAQVLIFNCLRNFFLKFLFSFEGFEREAETTKASKQTNTGVKFVTSEDTCQFDSCEISDMFSDHFVPSHASNHKNPESSGRLPSLQVNKLFNY